LHQGFVAVVDEQVGRQGAAHRHLVAALIFGVAGMAPDPGEFHLVPGVHPQEAGPQVAVGFAHEAFFLPAVDPFFLHGVYYVFGVGIDHHRDAFGFNGFQAHDHR
jgi:hypothetical protein